MLKLAEDCFKIDTPVVVSERSHEQGQLDSKLKRFAENLKSLIQNQSSYFRSILVSGDWGSGKTSVLQHLVSKLPEDDSKVTPIFFEAWKHESEDNLLMSLLWTLVEHSDVGRELLSQDSSSEDKDKLMEIYHYAISMASKFFIKSSIKDILENSEKLKHHSIQDQTSRYLEQRTNTNKFQIAFNELLTKLYKEQSVVIIVDDLDRCSPESAMLLLDHIRVLINATDTRINNLQSRCNFVVAMDKTVLKQAINYKFSALSRYDSHRYLEKLFSITLNVPITPPSTDNLSIDDRTNKLISDIFKQPYFSNHRLYIRCINQAVAFSSFSQSTQLDGKDQSATALTESDNQKLEAIDIEWIAAVNRWPELRTLVERKDEYFWLHVQSHITNNVKDEKDSEIIELLSQPGLKEFFIDSTVLGNIHNETSLQERFSHYKNTLNKLQQAGL